MNLAPIILLYYNRLEKIMGNYNKNFMQSYIGENSDNNNILSDLVI